MSKIESLIQKRTKLENNIATAKKRSSDYKKKLKLIDDEIKAAKGEEFYHAVEKLNLNSDEWMQVQNLISDQETLRKRLIGISNRAEEEEKADEE